MTSNEDAGRRALMEAGHQQLGDLAERWAAAVDRAAVPPAVEIPATVRDNSQTVTDYAFMRHRAPDKGVRTPEQRDRDIAWRDTFGYVHYTWHDVNPNGQRCRFDMLVHLNTGNVTYLFHTEYFTRVACGECEYSYATVYQEITTSDGTTSQPVPRCDLHADLFRRAVAGTPGLKLRESERLLIGQHD